MEIKDIQNMTAAEQAERFSGLIAFGEKCKERHDAAMTRNAAIVLEMASREAVRAPINFSSMCRRFYEASHQKRAESIARRWATIALDIARGSEDPRVYRSFALMPEVHQPNGPNTGYCCYWHHKPHIREPDTPLPPCPDDHPEGAAVSLNCCRPHRDFFFFVTGKNTG